MNSGIVIVAALAATVTAAVASGHNAEVLPAHQVQAQLEQLASKASSSGSSGATVATSGNLALNLSVRTSSGGAEIHAHYDDLMIVQQGSATLITGGSIIDAKTDSGGETKGTGIQNGKSQSITVGDVIIVPAGEPHQLLIPPGTLYSALVAKVKE